ncbi:MAG: acylphosphatase [Lachnospiraceae bacterium]|nr:acylphosphatase [Lachnospiraceae bacterium]
MVRYHMKFLGQVQGVGFRWQVRMAAQSLRLTGWVVNNWDGSVEMEIQGDEASIGELLRSLQEDRYIRIDEIQKESIPLDEKEGGFKVRY